MGRIGLQFRKGDWIALGFVCAAALAAVCSFPVLTADQSDFAQVWQDGQLVRQVPMSVDQTFQVRGIYTNTVTVRDGKIAVTHSDCPTNDCVHMGWLEDGGAIVCLPNRMEIRLSGDDAVDIVIQ